jgi:TonB-dependent Receptor Plug Domain
VDRRLEVAALFTSCPHRLVCLTASLFQLIVAAGAPAWAQAPAPHVTPPAVEHDPAEAHPAPITIEVRDGRRPPAAKSLSRAEVRQLPGAFGDPFRAIEALPGVVPIGSGLPFFYVRGAPPGNVGYFLDGWRVPLLYHVAIGPSVIHPGLIERVDLHSGGYPARFGRYAGGIIAAELTEPRSDFHGEANLRLFDAGALAEGGFDGERGTALLAGRYSYTALLFSLLVPSLKLDYRDYQARFTYDVTRDHRLTVLSIGSYDLLAREQRGGYGVLFGAEFYRVGLRHEYRYDSGIVRTDATFGLDQTSMGDEGKSASRSLLVRSSLEHRFDPRAQLRAGMDGNLERFSTTSPRYVDPDSPEATAFLANNPRRTDRVFGAWSDVVLEPTRDLEITPGARVDLYQSGGADAIAIEPRIAARFRINERLTLTHAYGLAHQPPSFVIPLPGRARAGLEGGLQRSVQLSSGAELSLPEHVSATGTVFYNAFFDMTDALASRTEGPPDAREVERTRGSALGFELMLHRNLSRRLGGYLSYTLSRSMRGTANENFPSAFDRTHTLSLALACALGRRWRVGGRSVFYTGAPAVEDPNGLAPAPRLARPPRGAPFFRLDLRLEKRWDLSRDVWLAFVTEVMNATLSKEEFGGQAVGPITIPSLGLEAGF